MKFAKIKYAKLKEPENNDGSWSLVLESKQDVINYFNLISNKISKDSFEFWIKAKKGNDPTTLTYISHQRLPNNLTHEIAYQYILSKVEQNNEITFFDYCNNMSSVYAQKYKNMLSIINDNNPVIINEAGGYCPLDDFFKSTEEICSPDIKTIKSYLSGEHKIFNEKNISINENTIVIENDSIISIELLTLIQCLNVNNYYILNEFELKTLGYNKNDYFKMFDNAINNGLKEIILETTLIKKTQFENLKSIVESVLIKNPEKKLKVHILRNGFDHQIKTTVKNIEVINY